MVNDLLYEDPIIASWARLCPREIYERSPFPEGRLYEDSLSFKNHVLWAHSFAVLDEPIYGYVNRAGSITDTKCVSQSKIEQFEYMLDAFCSGLESSEGDYDKALRFHTALELSRLYRMLRFSPLQGEELRRRQEAILEFMRGCISPLLADERISKVNKVRFLLLSISPKAYNMVFSLYENWFNRK